jgi:hypothetical protein
VFAICCAYVRGWTVGFDMASLRWSCLCIGTRALACVAAPLPAQTHTFIPPALANSRNRVDECMWRNMRAWQLRATVRVRG